MISERFKSHQRTAARSVATSVPFIWSVVAFLLAVGPVNAGYSWSIEKQVRNVPRPKNEYEAYYRENAREALRMACLLLVAAESDLPPYIRSGLVRNMPKLYNPMYQKLWLLNDYEKKLLENVTLGSEGALAKGGEAERDYMRWMSVNYVFLADTCYLQCGLSIIHFVLFLPGMSSWDCMAQSAEATP